MTSRYVKLATALPPRLTRFFARYPPAAILPEGTASTAPSPSTLGQSALTTGLSAPSPFAAYRHAVTGKRQEPAFSLRRQAEMVKLARQHGVEELLPFTVKGTEERIRRRAENGLRVKGTGIGQRVKGKQAERSMQARLEKRRQAMLEMPKMIQMWKERGHGRGWKKWPK